MNFHWNPDSLHQAGHDRVWDKYFMGIALLCEKRSKDVHRQIGACIVNDEPRVIGTGYNGMPLRCHDNLMPWTERDESSGQRLKHYYVCHAELNAIVNRDLRSVAGCTMYVTLFPCNECAKLIVKSGIKRIIYLNDDKNEKNEFKVGKKILENANILLLKYEESTSITINLGESAEPNEPKRAKTELDWETFFMSLAIISAEVRSVQSAQEGVCIVNEDKRIVGLGYVEDSMLAAEENPIQPTSLYMSHAPMNAILHENPNSLRGCELYATQFPCNECAKLIIQCGIRKVIYMKDGLTGQGEDKKQQQNRRDATIQMFQLSGIALHKFIPANGQKEILLDFKER